MRKMLLTLGLIVASLILALLLILVLVNIGDSPLDPQVQQALSVAHSTDARKIKTFYNLYGINAPLGKDPETDGQTAYQNLQTLLQDSKHRIVLPPHEQNRLRYDSGHAGVFNAAFPSKSEWQKLQPEVAVYLQKNAVLIDRFEKIVMMGPYARPANLSLQESGSSTILYATRWYQARSIELFYDGKYNEAAQRTRALQSFLAGSLTGDQSLIEGLILVAALKINRNFATSASGVNSAAKTAFTAVLSSLKTDFDSDHLLQRMIDSEIQAINSVTSRPLSVSDVSLSETGAANQGSIFDPVINYLMKPHETLNAIYDELVRNIRSDCAGCETQLAAEPQPMHWEFSDIRNPCGKLIARMIFRISPLRFKKFQDDVKVLNSEVKTEKPR